MHTQNYPHNGLYNYAYTHMYSLQLPYTTNILYICWYVPGNLLRSLMISFLLCCIDILSSLITSPTITNAMNWLVYAWGVVYDHVTVGITHVHVRTLVLATPISGPALMWTPQWVSLEMLLPTVVVKRWYIRTWQYILMAYSCDLQDTHTHTSTHVCGHTHTHRTW